jgi:hypothetical protein
MIFNLITQVTKATMELLTLARYILETSLMNYEYVTESESRMAAAAMALAIQMTQPHLKQGHEIWVR